MVKYTTLQRLLWGSYTKVTWKISNQLFFSLWDARVLVKRPAKRILILGVETGYALGTRLYLIHCDIRYAL